MIKVFEEVQGPVLAVERVPREDVSSYGDHRCGGDSAGRLPDTRSGREAAAERSAVGSRHHRPLHSDAGHLPGSPSDGQDRTGEIQLTNGLRHLLKSRPIYGCRIDGVRHDTGNKLGFLKAVVYFALRRPDLGEPFRQYLMGIDLEQVNSSR